MSHENPVDHWKAIFSACLISSAGALMFCVFPVVLGVVGDQFKLDDQQLGYLSSTFYIGFFVIAISTAFWLRRLNWRVSALIGISLTAVSLFALSEAENYRTQMVLMIAIGCGMGIAYSLATEILSDSSNPDRAFGIKLTFENMPGTGLLFLLPAFVVPKWGFHGVITVLAVTVIVFGLAIFWLPQRGIKDLALTVENPTNVTGHSSYLAWFGLSAIFLYALGLIAPWVFMERIGASLMFKADDIGLVLSVGLASSILGGLAAAFVGERFGQIKPVLVIMAIYFLALLGLGRSQDFMGYAVSCTMLLFTLNFVVAYQLGLTAKVDHKGSLIVLSAAALSGAMIVGPAVAGNLVDGKDYSGVLIFSGLCGVASLVADLFVCWRTNPREALNKPPQNAAGDSN